MERSIQEGDILYDKYDDKYHVCKIIKVDEFGTYHTLTYAPIDIIPTEDDIGQLEVFVWHSPIASFPNSKFLTNIPVKEEELMGYIEYLKLTNFNKYLEVTDQDINDMVQQAIMSYNEGNRLADEGKFEQAIDLYTEAIDLHPLFFEAIDNRGLTFMDLGEFEEAILDFEESLRIEPEGMTAMFSMGECYFKMGEYEKALKQFELTHQLHPQEPICKEWINKTKKNLENS